MATVRPSACGIDKYYFVNFTSEAIAFGLSREDCVPYIKQIDRDKLAEPLIQLMLTMEEVGWSPGMLNYVITQLCGHPLDKTADILPLSYENITLIVGVLETVKLELYRRLAAPYEDKKMKEHGDVGYAEMLK